MIKARAKPNMIKSVCQEGKWNLLSIQVFSYGCLQNLRDHSLSNEREIFALPLQLRWDNHQKERSALSSLRESYPTILIQRSSECSHLNPTVPSNIPKKQRDSSKWIIPYPNSTETQGEPWENWVSQGFLSDQCDSCISPESGGFDVRWVRFPKHIPLFSTLSQLESVGFGDSSNWVQRVVRELVVEIAV